MSFKTKIVNKLKEYEEQEKEKEKQYLINQIGTIENFSLPFALLKLSINNNFLPLSINSYYEKILPEIDSLRKRDGSKYSSNYLFAVKSALFTNKLFEKKINNLYGLNLKNAINYMKKLKKVEKPLNNIDNNKNTFLGKKRQIKKNFSVRKYEKYIHTYEILNDLSETFPKNSEESNKIKINFNKYKTTTDLMEKNMNIDKICGMLIIYKYYKNFLKKFLYGKSMNINYVKRMNLNKQISGLKDGFDLVQFCIKNIVNSKNIDSEN